MKRIDPLYKIAAIIAAVAVIIAAFSAIFINGGEIGLPSGETATLANVDAPEPSVSARPGPSASARPEPSGASPSPTPAPSASPSPSPTAVASPPAELSETFPDVFDALLELAAMESEDEFTEFGLSAMHISGLSYYYIAELIFGGHDWEFYAVADEESGADATKTYNASYSMDSFDPDIMAEASVASYETIAARYGEASDVLVLADN